MLGSPCSPCCGVCQRYVPRNEISASVTVPYLPGWREIVGLRSCPFDIQSPILNGGTQPQGLGSFTLSFIGFSGASYLFRYSRNDTISSSLAGCSQSAYQAYVEQNVFGDLSNPTYPPSPLGVVARSYFAEVRLYPLADGEFSPPRSIATDTFGLVGDYCGLVEFIYVETAEVRWSHGVNASYSITMRPAGAPAIGSSSPTAALPPVWTGSGNPSNVTSDGLDHTQYKPWTYDSKIFRPDGDPPFVERPGPTSPIFVQSAFSPAQYQEDSVTVFSGGTFTIHE